MPDPRLTSVCLLTSNPWKDSWLQAVLLINDLRRRLLSLYWLPAAGSLIWLLIIWMRSSVNRFLCNMSSPIVQYIVVRGDLGWPVGALIAQGAHSSVAAIANSLQTETTKQYLQDLDRMHKIVLKAENESQLKDLVDKLEADSISHHAWIEQPENILCSVSSAPNHKSVLQPYFKDYKLFKWMSFQIFVWLMSKGRTIFIQNNESLAISFLSVMCRASFSFFARQQR